MGDLESAWQAAVTQAVGTYHFLEGKAFLKSVGAQGQRWKLHPQVLTHRYSSTEAIIVSVLVEVFHQMEGLQGVVIPDAGDSEKRPSEHIWPGAPAAAALVMEPDDRQRLIIQELLR